MLTANEVIETSRGFVFWLIASLVWVTLMVSFMGGSL
jgi:hypothetical protein